MVGQQRDVLVCSCLLRLGRLLEMTGVDTPLIPAQ